MTTPALQRIWMIAVVFLSVGFSRTSGAALKESIDADYRANLGSLFVYFHRHPELSFREFETARRLADELRSLGYDVTEGVGGTGVVAVLKNGAGPTVMLRADMDGLPVKEQTGLPYASTTTQVDVSGVEQPVMHACGHDVHMTALVGAARQLLERRDRWSGTLVLIAQPAEERISGAVAMLKDGLYTRFPKPDYALAFHVSAVLPSGTIKVPLAAAYSSSDSVDIVVHGVGAHGASPHRGVDPVLVASQIVITLQTLVSRTVDPLKPGVITVGAIHGGTKHNIIGDRVEMQLTVRADDSATRRLLLDGIDRVASGVARSLGVPENLLPEVTRSRTETTPPTVNDEPTARLLKETFQKHFPEGTVVETPREGMGAEDFAYFVQPDLKVKGVYFQIGGTPAKEVDRAPSHHSPLFKIEAEPSIKVGVESMVVAAVTLLRPGTAER